MNELKNKLNIDKLRQLPWKRIALIGAPCLLIVVLALVFSLVTNKPAPTPGSPESPKPAVVAVVPTTPSPSPSAAPVVSEDAEGIKLQLKLSSTEEDLQITVCDEKGEAITGVEFELKLTYPDKTGHAFKTGADGRLYRTKLAAGEYKVELLEKEGYVLPAAQSITVKAKLQYVPISNVSQQTEVKPVTQLPEEETKPAQPQEAPAAEAEEIQTPESSGDVIIIGGTDEPVVKDDGSGSLVLEETKPVLDASGRPVYDYSYETGANGCLLLSENGQESDVMPVEENGRLAYGMRRVTTILRSDASGVTEVTEIPAVPEEGVEYITEESAQRVEVMDTAGVPFSAYKITATPATETVTTPVGWQTENGKTFYYDLNGNKVTGLKSIDGKLYYFDDSGVKAGSLGIDVSYFNGEIDWNKVKAQGIDFAIIRVAGRTWGSGILFEDSNSYKQMENGGEYLQQAKAAGLKVGVYVYSSAINTNEAVEEASLALDILNGTALDLPVYIDMEYSGDYPNGRADKLTAQQRFEIVEAFCTTVKSGGYTPGVYAGQYYFENGALNFSQVSKYNVWLASYTRDQKLPSFSGYNMWQFTSAGTVNGISGNVDLNVIF